MRLPELQDGGILIKDENDEWRCVMPDYFDKQTTRQERLFLTWVFILSGILFAIAAGLWWFS